jgi:hypothetical protein
VFKLFPGICIQRIHSMMTCVSIDTSTAYILVNSKLFLSYTDLNILSFLNPVLKKLSSLAR